MHINFSPDVAAVVSTLAGFHPRSPEALAEARPRGGRGRKARDRQR